MDDKHTKKSWSELSAFGKEQVNKLQKYRKKPGLLGILFVIWFFSLPVVFLCGIIIGNIVLIIFGASAFVATMLIILIVQLINKNSKKNYVLNNSQTKTIHATVLDSVANYYVRWYRSLLNHGKYQKIVNYDIIALINNIECTGYSNKSYEKNAEIEVLYNEKYPDFFIISE